METKIDILKRVPLFAGLSRDDLQTVASLADEIDVPSGTTLTSQGANAYEFFVIVDGEAVVEQDGRRLRTLDRGHFLGEVALLTHSPRTATVTTTEPTRLLVLTDRAFRHLTASLPALAKRTWAAAAARTA